VIPREGGPIMILKRVEGDLAHCEWTEMMHSQKKAFKLSELWELVPVKVPDGG
jgi:uncharacterized protein YodC (DUF2158 family)